MKDQVIRKVSRQDGGIPQTIQQLIRKYSLDTMWDNIQTGTINADRIKTGSINANLIKSGTMTADRIKGGTLILGGENDVNGSMQIKDAFGNNLVSIGEEGIKLENGTQLITEDGILSVIQFGKYEWENVGFSADPSSNTMWKMTYKIPVYIPKGYTILDARVVLMHSPIKWSGYGKSGWGYCRNLKLYKNEQSSEWYEELVLDSEGFTDEEYYTNEIEKAFGNSEFLPSVPSNELHKVETVISSNIARHLVTDKRITLQIHSADNLPEFNIDVGDVYSSKCLNSTGNCIALLTVIGFYKGGK